MPGGWWCCCPAPKATCLIAEDEFVYEDSPDPPVEWTEVAGNWQIDSDNFLVTDDTNAYLEYASGHPDGVAEHCVLLYILNDGIHNLPGTKVRIVLATSLYAEYEIGEDFSGDLQYARGCDIVRIFNDTTLLKESMPFSPHLITSENGECRVLRAGYSETSGILWALGRIYDADTYVSPCVTDTIASAPAVGKAKVGIGTGDVVEGGIAIDYFLWLEHNRGAITNCADPCHEGSYRTCHFAWPWLVKAGTSISHMGCGWAIQSGTWDAGGGVVGHLARWLETSSSDAIIESLTEQRKDTCIQYYPAGYHRSILIFQATEGDVVRHFIDWDGTDGHEVRIVVGDTNGEGASIALYKGDTELETKTFLITIKDGVDYVLKSCLVRADDGSGLDIFSAVIGTAMSAFWEDPPHEPYVPDTLIPMRIVDYTTVYGNLRVGFGTGTVTGKVRFHSLANYNQDILYHGKSNYGICRLCERLECAHCPGGARPDLGISLEISGFGTPYGGMCDCTDFDGTYPGAIADACTAWVLTFDDNCTTGIYPNYSLHVIWYITDEGGGDWALNIQFAMGFAWSNYAHFWWYKKVFAQDVMCNSLVDEVIPYDSYALVGFGTSIWPTHDDPWCENMDGLTIVATSY